jgi:peptidyl-prolyl cis-trans isomerase C
VTFFIGGKQMMKKGGSYIFILFICGMIVFSCKNNGKGTAPISPSGESVEPIATPLTDVKENSMIASVNGTVITKSEVDSERDKLVRQFQGKIPPDQMDAILPKLWQQALENMINLRLLKQEADRKNIQQDNEAIDKQIAQISSRFPNPEKFKEQLATLGISEEKLRKEIGESLRIEQLLKSKPEQDLEVSEKDIEDFYRDNPENFRMPERIQASHILIKVDSEDTPEAKEQKRQKLSSIREEIENGADFAQLAHEHSDCPSKSRGGDLGLFERGKMVKPFEDVAFQLKVGEVSDIVETQFGLHLIKSTDRQEGRVMPLEKAREKIISYLSRQKQDQAINDYLMKLRSEAKIDYLEGFKP